MAARGWGGSVATAVGVAAGAGAAQLGFGYGLGIIAWLPSTGGNSEATWVASLTWAAWIAATSTVAGAVCAHRLGGGGRGSAGRAGDPPPTLATLLWRAALAVSSAIGALVTVVLVAVPARAVVRADTSAPQTVAAGYAILGILLGLVAAIWAISSPAVASNVLGTVCWLWALAVISVVDGVLSGRGLSAAQLGVWQLTSDGERFWFREYFYWPGAALSLGSALLIGALAARSAARRPATRVGAAISGISGPLLVAVAYFVAAPRLVGIRPEQVSAHLMAPYAVVAGLAGSALVAALAQRSETMARQADSLDSRSEPRPSGTGPDAPPPTDGSPASPRPGETRLGETRPGETRSQEAGGKTRRSDATAPSADADPGEQTDRTDGPGAGPSGGADRPARVPGQPGRRARRGADQADTAPVPSSAAPVRSQDAGSDGEPAPVADGTAGPEEPAEVTEGGAKGRLGRFGRRSR
ncbi:hypothetical protein [Plantactinospora sp. KLBMP9567]|uniref:hypothetical protein n=1 Tax=Plantactinospora sp. KLBMP9567 TaxID=3085900 RepID=UPI00298100A3|nr:hypothetical protein [Plantactinospora sp. KLBMP9567]MDW5327300.1 hypothetical protein [Plantactinospora sp. KLBMP9567]